MTFAIRSYHPSDLPSLYRICLRTGKNGADASPLYHDPDLLGHYYAAPYAVLEADLCFVLTQAGTPHGYILGTRNSVAFHNHCEQEWFPCLRKRYPLPRAKEVSPDAQLIRLLHEGYAVNPDLMAYPAHLHIDLLPEAQGKGCGYTLIHTFLERLRVLSVPAVHLEVGIDNFRAIQFYERVGFHRIKEYEESIAFGMQLV